MPQLPQAAPSLTTLRPVADPPNLDFYSTAAQVIPLIFITLAIDLRGFFESPLDRKLRLWVRVREQTEPSLVATTAEVNRARAKVELGRELTPEQQFAAVERAHESVAKMFDGTEQPLQTAARRARIGAALASVISMLALIVGEAVALRVLEAGEGSKAASGIIESVLWLGAGLLSWRLFDRVLDTVMHDGAVPERWRFRILGAATGLVLAATYIAWHSV